MYKPTEKYLRAIYSNKWHYVAINGKKGQSVF